MLRDPVCGMQIQDSEAYAVRHVGDADVALCSAACVAQFDAAPQHYMQLLNHPSTLRHVGGTPLLRPLAAGVAAILGLLIFYLGIITLAQGWEHATAQLVDDRKFTAAIVLGFGTQVGLYAYLRGLHTQTTVGGVAASTGTSTAAMLVCCAHHLTHRVVGRAALDAVYPLARDRLAFAELRSEGLEPHAVREVWLFASAAADSSVDIASSFERKLAARLAHVSQTPDAKALAESWRARAGQIGAPAGLELAEAFTVRHVG